MSDSKLDAMERALVAARRYYHARRIVKQAEADAQRALDEYEQAIARLILV